MIKKLAILILLTLLPCYTVLAFEFLFEDNKGHYHYRCNDAGVLDDIVISFRHNGVMINSKKHGVIQRRVNPEGKPIRKHKNNAHIIAKKFCNEGPGFQIYVLE